MKKPPRRTEVPFTPSQIRCLRRCAYLILEGREQRAAREFAREFNQSPRLFPTREARVKWAFERLDHKATPAQKLELEQFLKEHPDVVRPT